MLATIRVFNTTKAMIPRIWDVNSAVHIKNGMKYLNPTVNGRRHRNNYPREAKKLSQGYNLLTMPYLAFYV